MTNAVKILLIKNLIRHDGNLHYIQITIEGVDHWTWVPHLEGSYIRVMQPTNSTWSTFDLAECDDLSLTAILASLRPGADLDVLQLEMELYE